MCFHLQQIYRRTNGVGMERREIQSVTMHAGLCDAAYCLVSAKNERKDCTAMSCAKRQRADSVLPCR